MIIIINMVWNFTFSLIFDHFVFQGIGHCKILSMKPAEISTRNTWGYQYHIWSPFNQFTLIQAYMVLERLFKPWFLLNAHAMSFKSSGKSDIFRIQRPAPSDVRLCGWRRRRLSTVIFIAFPANALRLTRT